jgi:hypothetical protein
LISLLLEIILEIKLTIPIGKQTVTSISECAYFR